MCVHVLCMCVQQVMHGVYLEDALHGIVRHKMGTVCKTHTLWPKHVKHVQARVNPSTRTHLSPIQHKMSQTFCQTFSMQQWTTPMKNAWTLVKMPQYMFRMPHRANTNTHRSNGTQPNHNFEKTFTKTWTPTHFRKIPNFGNPNLFSA